MLKATDTIRQWPGVSFRIRGARDYVTLSRRGMDDIRLHRSDAAAAIRGVRSAARRGLAVAHIGLTGPAKQ